MTEPQSNAPATSPARRVSVEPITNFYERHGDKCKPPQPPPVIETLAELSKDHGALLNYYIPRHPLMLVTASHTAEAPLMNWLLIGFPADRLDEHGHIIDLDAKPKE